MGWFYMLKIPETIISISFEAGRWSVVEITVNGIKMLILGVYVPH